MMRHVMTANQRARQAIIAIQALENVIDAAVGVDVVADHTTDPDEREDLRREVASARREVGQLAGRAAKGLLSAAESLRLVAKMAG